jgi:cysteine desulfurase
VTCDDAPGLVVDALGRRCPVPVIELAAHLGDVEVGQVVDVLSDDPASRVDIPVWCRMKGHEYVGSTPGEQGSAHRVRRMH